MFLAGKARSRKGGLVRPIQYSTAINIEAIPLAKMAPSTPQCTGARLAAGVRLGYQRPDVTQWASCMSPGAVAVNKPPPLPYLAAAGPPSKK
ncbi:hypothetical protein CDAR_535061 [Caerostris darwini]|uniref:Uncharacterized protein n=1 Tax=Caerostris darwini TaxID=1538125 RepID=A0AAV4QLJ6_9ARAC|nr:hypothetical protein CDAR_535061 [Caerostris darwini]